MSGDVEVMKHRKVAGIGRCALCDGSWPCYTARVRHEVAEYLRDVVVAAHETDGVEAAADLIDIED